MIALLVAVVLWAGCQAAWAAQDNAGVQKVSLGQSVKDRAGFAWQCKAARDEVAPEFFYCPTSGKAPEQWILRSVGPLPSKGWWQSQRDVEPGETYRFRARLETHGVAFPRLAAFVRLEWLGRHGGPVHWDEAAIGPYHPSGTPVPATPEWPREQGVDDRGGQWFEGVYRAPKEAEAVRIELHLEWATGEARWSDISWEKCPPPPERRVRLAAIHYRPGGKSPQANREEFAPLVAEAARQGAHLVVLPETLTFYGTGLSYVECAEPIPGASTDYFAHLARRHRLYLVVGLLERDGPLVYNVAVLIGPDGELIGKYRKVCLPRGELEGGITPGDSYPVFDTPLGRIGMMICYDGFFPEVARRLAEAGAEVIAFPVWGCNPLLVSARACENQVYIVSSTYTDVSQHWMVSGIFGHDGRLLARAEKFGSVVVAEVDLAQRTLWAGLGDFRAEVHRHRPPSAREYFQAARQATGMDSNAWPKDVEPHWTPVAERRWKPGQEASESSSRAPAEKSSFRIAPREPHDALNSFRTHDGFRMELVAAEPNVVDPVAMVYDEFGRAYVAEMRDYPYTDKTTDVPFQERLHDAPLGRIRLLEDRDGDGSLETSTVFADELSWPTGLALWQGGLFVTATPDIWYLKDTDGDGKADVRKRVYTGFRKYNVQAVINNLQWGLDHRIYGAGSSNGGMIQNLENPEEPAVRMGTHDFRFDPKTGRFELLSGGGRFGLAFDDWGNRFICNIRNPIRHAVFPDEAARRNQRVPFPPGIVDVAEAGDTIPVYRSSAPEPWRIENARRLAEDRTAASPRSESVAAGYMTSACGLTIYRGSAYPPEYYGQAFLGEVAGNLIHRQRLVPDGVTFRSRRIDTLGEFVTSDDNWFRPVNFVNAPDGTLHVLDMYRETIEHPWSIPEDLKQKLDLESGRDRGRIYRLAPPGFVYRQPIWPGRLDTEQLVALFEHPNGWHRDTAFRLIYERQDRRAIEPLRALLHRPAQKQKDERDAVACVLALWSLEGLGALQESDLLAAYEHPDPHVREHAVQLAGRHMSSPAIWELLHRAIEDKAIRVAYQAVLAAGGLPEQERWLVVCRAIEQPHTDRWWHYAILSTAHGQEMSLFRKLVRENLVREHIHASNCVEGQDFVWMLAECVAAAGSSDEIAAVVRQLISGAETGGLREPSWHLLAALDSGARRRGRRLVDLVSDAEVKQQLTRVARQAVAIAGSAQQPLAVRVAALHLASQLAWPEVQPLFARLMSAAEPSQLEGTALRLALGSAEPNAVQCVIDQYRRLSPAARSEALSLLVARPASASRLLDALEDGRVPVADLSPGQAGVLVRSRDPSVQERARRVLQAPPSDRQEVVRQYRHQVAALGDARAGREVFAQSCSSCHRLHGLGSDVGPPLETVLHRSIDELLVAILDPSCEVAPNYQEYLAVLRDGRTVTGIMAEESPSAITLRRAGQQQETLARSDIEELFSTGKSLMPEGLERNISPQQMADLLAFLKRPEWHTAEESSAGHR